jgi:hypothetical protein
MYISGRRVQKPKKRHKLLKLLFLLIIIAVVFAAIYWLLSRQSLSSSGTAGNVYQTDFKEPPKQHVTEDYFEFDLPQDWKKTIVKTTPYHSITWVGTARESDGRSLEVFIDSRPLEPEINRVAPVVSGGNHLLVSDISDNCISFTRNFAKLTLSELGRFGPTQTKWQGIRFICDVSKSTRNVVGTGSKEGLNTVTLSGKKGTHHYFIVYTDHASHRDDKMFTDILQSFKAR